MKGLQRAVVLFGILVVSAKNEDMPNYVGSSNPADVGKVAAPASIPGSPESRKKIGRKRLMEKTRENAGITGERFQNEQLDFGGAVGVTSKNEPSSEQAGYKSPIAGAPSSQNSK
jgi:hypothetical protein